MKINVVELLGFDKLFGDDEFDQIAALAQLPLSASIELLAWSTAQLSLDASNPKTHYTVLNYWFSLFPAKEKREFKDVPHMGLQFIALPVSLKVTELLIQHADRNATSKELNSKQAFALFKIYIYQSLQYTDKINSFRTTLTREDFSNLNKIINVTLPANIPYFDLKMGSSLQIEIYKAAEFFKFCLNNEESPFLSNYLSALGYNTWEEYLAQILALYFHLYNELSKGVIKSGIELDPLDSSDTQRAMRELLELLKIDLNTFTPNLDFMSIRSNPVMRTDENLYIILSNELLLNKIFQVIQFNFGDFIANNGGRIHDTAINRSLDYKPLYSTLFTEKALLYNVLGYITDGKRKYIVRNGDEVKAITGASKTEPDYYIREGNNVYIFECKDALFNIAAKTSNDIEEVKKEIIKKLAKNQNGKPKGIGQLAKVIEYIAEGDYNAVDNKIPTSVNVYPILVITDVSFAALGINHILDNKLSELLATVDYTEKPTHVRVKPLILMRMDSLIEFREIFKDETIPFKKAIGAYISKIRDPSSMLNPIQSFDDFIKRRFGKVMSGFWVGMEGDIKTILRHLNTNTSIN